MAEAPLPNWGWWDPYDFKMDIYKPHMLKERDNDFHMLQISDPREYYRGLKREWNYRYDESNHLVRELHDLGARIPRRFSLEMQRKNKDHYEITVKQIRKENNRILVRRCRYYILKLAVEQAQITNRLLSTSERASVLAHELYHSEDEMPNERL
ncbi:hypothetical protein HAX54_031832 [Datura stramonium]|uniref:Uncharacterized protein n=1 Tax=Datura stramonium TaxID=4076 RepID=A0ABS8V9S7_DATST|nr:hypothetical protein [Datura stramonium]